MSYNLLDQWERVKAGCRLRRVAFKTIAKRNLTRGKSMPSPRFSAIMGFIILLIAVAAVHAGTCTHRITVSTDDLEYSTLGGYDVVSLRGARSLNRPGEPRLPLIPLRIALPGGCEIVDFAVTDKDSVVLAGNFLVWPSQPPQPLTWGGPHMFVGPLGDIYNGNAAYPERPAEIVGTGRLGGVTICEILVFPLRYLPVDRTLILYTNVAVEITYRWQAAMSSEVAAGPGLELAGRVVSNPGDLWQVEQHMMHESSPIPLGGEPVDYLIITRDSLKTYFEPLKQWKMRKGLRTRIIGVETIALSYTGCDLQEKVRNCIKDFHSSSGTDWVLLGGDTQIIPVRQAYVDLSDRPYLPCDLYYSDLDGTWNDDGDLYWGEVPSDNIDMYADVYVGRAPVANGSEVGTFVEKVLTYEGLYEIPQDYQLEMLFIGEVLWGDPADPLDPEYTDAGVAKNIIDAAYVPDRFAIAKLYESLGNLNYGSVMGALNQGKNIINILCHGQYTGVSLGSEAMTNADLESLVNGPRYGLMYSAACLNGGFDQNDCLGEAWVLSRGGGGFFVGNSRYGYNSPGFPGEGPSDYYDQSFFQAVFMTGFTNLGKAHADSKHEFVAESRTDAYMRYLMYDLNLLGDPEARLWTDTPASLVVTCSDQINLGPQTYAVSVESGGSPVVGATVCLYKGDDVYCVEETDGAGGVAAFIDPAATGILYVTVTKPDFLPFVGQAAVTDGMPPAVPGSIAAEQKPGPSVDVTWCAVADEDLHHYKVYRNTLPLPESLLSVPPTVTAYADSNVVEGSTYYYWVTSVDSSGNESDFPEACVIIVEATTSVSIGDVESDPGILITPNPFTHSVRFAVRGGPDSATEVEIYDIRGRWVSSVRPVKTADGLWVGGWDAEDGSGQPLPAGIYLVRFSTGSEASTHKVILLR